MRCCVLASVKGLFCDEGGALYETQINDHSWNSSNSSNRTQAVGQKKPVMVNGRPVYDIQGNVWEWVNDWYGQTLQGGADPQGPSTVSGRVMCGGGWIDGAQLLRSGFPNSWAPEVRNYIVGFRLVRTAQ